MAPSAPRTTQVGVAILETGKVQIRPSMRSQTADRSVLLRRIVSLSDRRWTEPLPVTAILIHHPEGPILFDTGQSPKCNQPGYYPPWMPLPRLLARFSITLDQGIGARLRAHGIDPKDLKAVILSHLHHDHAGGLNDIPADVPVFVSKPHWEVFKHRLHATIEGCLPQHWPTNFSPRFLEPEEHPVGPWARSYPITKDGRVVAVDTPGHVPGHVSVIVFGDEATYFLTGDATYGLDLLDGEAVDGINDDPQEALRSVRKIREFAREAEVVVLAAHDPGIEECLAKRKVYRPREL